VTTPQTNLVHQAKQGNPDAIAALLNRNLAAQNITAKATLNDGCLHIMLEAAQPLVQSTLVAFIHNGLSKLNPAACRVVRVSGRAIADELPSWTEEFQLDLPTLPTTLNVPKDLPKPRVQQKPKKLTQAPPPTSNHHLVRFMVAAFCGALLIGSGAVFFAFRNSSMANQAKYRLELIRQRQQDYFGLHDRFAPNLQTLDASLATATADYRYEMVVPGNNQVLYAAIPKQKGAMGYLGALLMSSTTMVTRSQEVTATRSSTTVTRVSSGQSSSRICEVKGLQQIPSNELPIANDQISCPQN
jgi:hypothetical protein